MQVVKIVCSLVVCAQLIVDRVQYMNFFLVNQRSAMTALLYRVLILRMAKPAQSRPSFTALIGCGANESLAMTQFL